ncbi:hypothetical protein, partial [Endozoicomonas sp. ONNA1]|uniref:hypothetical protein n=1 Tax=Endozoicomonas sp. ONNA1 TaxID=2828740 RepID=UPI0021490081
MSFGLPPAYGSTSQPSQNHLPDAHQDGKPTSDLNPNALPFVPRGSRSDQSSDTLPTIRRRRTTAHRAPSSQRWHRSTRKKSPEAAEKKIHEAYKALKNQQFTHAEDKFQATLQEYRGQLSEADYQSSVIGLARSLNEQNREKQKKAFYRLEQLRLRGSLTPLGASTTPNLDVTLSRCEQALGLLSDAETRLIRLRNKTADADEEILCQKSHNFDADITNARLWKLMGKHQMSETLMVNMKTELTRKLLSNPSTATAETLYKQLRIVTLALVRLLQERSLYEWAEDLLLDMIGKRP